MTSIHIAWWARYFVKSARLWYRLTKREPDYIRVTNFVAKYGIRIKVKEHATGER